MTVMQQHPNDQHAPNDLQRKLSNRHLQLIAIGGAIGTGLFMGSGKTISLAGPSILFIYMIIGTMFFFLMRALGELLLANLQYKSFVDMAHDLIGPWAGYYIGWTYWLGWVLVGIADLAAVINYLGFWLPEGVSFTPMGQALISAGCVLFVLGLNLLTVRLFGEIEFWFALIKILADDKPELETVLAEQVRFNHTFWMLTFVDLQHEPRIKLVWDYLRKQADQYQHLLVD